MGERPLTTYFPNFTGLGILVVTSKLHHILAKVRSEE